MSLFGFVLVSLVGLRLLAISAGTAAETSSIAANLTRARIEELLSLPPERLKEHNSPQICRQFQPGQGRTYVPHTTIVAPDPARLDLAVTVNWQLAYEPSANCTGNQVTYSRTLQTRIQAPVQP